MKDDGGINFGNFWELAWGRNSVLEEGGRERDGDGACMEMEAVDHKS